MSEYQSLNDRLEILSSEVAAVVTVVISFVVVFIRVDGDSVVVANIIVFKYFCSC